VPGLIWRARKPSREGRSLPVHKR